MGNSSAVPLSTGVTLSTLELGLIERAIHLAFPTCSEGCVPWRQGESKGGSFLYVCTQCFSFLCQAHLVEFIWVTHIQYDFSMQKNTHIHLTCAQRRRNWQSCTVSIHLFQALTSGKIQS